MPNKISAVEEIKREMRTGWPYGASEAYKRIPILLDRITELEAALAPFATIAAKIGKHTLPHELTQVYMRDLVSALEFMDPTNSPRVVQQDFGIPAE